VAASEKLISPKFLAVAVHLNILTVDDALAIEEERAESARWFPPAPLCGELGRDRKLITARDCEVIEEKKAELTKAGYLLRDPLAKSVQKRGTVRAGVIVGSLVLLMVAAAWGISRDVEVTSAVGGLAAAIVTALHWMSPAVIDGRILWHRYVRHAAIAALPISFGYSVLIILWFDSPKSIYLTALTPAQSTLMSVLTLSVSATYFAVQASWRRTELRASRVREQRLGRTCTRTLEAWFSSTTFADAAAGMVQDAVRILSVNIWAGLVGRIVLGNRDVASVHVIYLEPSASGNTFDVKLYETSDSRADVKLATDRIRAAHHPVHFDTQWYDKTVSHCQRVAGENWTDLFIKQLDRSERVSFTGLVFSRRKPIHSNDLDRCPVFDRTYMSCLKDVNPLVRNALDFRSVIAYPVFSSKNQDGAPRGVLVALRAMRNGFLPQDREAMQKIALLMGIALDTQTLSAQTASAVTP
jgi:GAF domain-containing protein